MSEKSLIKIGKIATFVIVLLGIIWIPIMDKIGGGVMYQYPECPGHMLHL